MSLGSQQLSKSSYVGHIGPMSCAFHAPRIHKHAATWRVSTSNLRQEATLPWTTPGHTNSSRTTLSSACRALNDVRVRNTLTSASVRSNWAPDVADPANARTPCQWNHPIPCPARRNVAGPVRADMASSDGVHSDDPSPNESFWAKGVVKRIVAGIFLGGVGGVAVILGGSFYSAMIALFIFQAAQEYFGFVDAIGSRTGNSPLPKWAMACVTMSCLSLPLYTYMTGGKIAVALAFASFVVISIITMNTEKPKLSDFSVAIFGLLYCGYLPTYWIKLRLMTVPALNTQLAVQWPVLMGGLTHVTVGFVATFVAVACVALADIGAYIVGKNFGKTPLTRISPKKTVEGALGGLGASIGTAMALRLVFQWPASALGAVGLGMAIFLSSLLGDLIESVMKRDAGMKDSGSAIPGHGGVLDRFDSYIFTGTVVYSYTKCCALFCL